MILYKLINKKTGRVYIGLCEEEPDISTINVPNNVRRDFDNFGKDSFTLLKIARHNNESKAKHKAEILIEQETNPYNACTSEPVLEPKYEIVEQFPEYPILEA